jgi:predicted metal-dependent HD superfamily phosphohydrolase
MLERPESIYILKRLAGLPPEVYYHSLDHTLDVFKASLVLAKAEGIGEGGTALVATAALYHDSGFLYKSDGHEAVSCRIARAALPGFGYGEESVEKICGMIMATKLPQRPQTKLEQILCDADLDYLGRDDFSEIADRLYREMLAAGRIADEDSWNRLQVDFLQKHHYFTDTARRLRSRKKEENLEALLSKLHNE